MKSIRLIVVLLCFVAVFSFSSNVWAQDTVDDVATDVTEILAENEETAVDTEVIVDDAEAVAEDDVVDDTAEEPPAESDDSETNAVEAVVDETAKENVVEEIEGTAADPKATVESGVSGRSGNYQWSEDYYNSNLDIPSQGDVNYNYGK